MMFKVALYLQTLNYRPVKVFIALATGHTGVLAVSSKIWFHPRHAVS